MITLTKAKEALKKEVEQLQDETTIEKLHIYIMGMKAQQGIERNSA